MVSWRWAAASEIGTSHIHTGDRLQDAYAVSAIGSDGIFAVVADGAGSAKFGANGAWLVCRTLTVHFREWRKVSLELPSDEIIADWIDDVRDRISTIALQRNSTPRQFAATLAAILITPTEVLTMYIGDSSIAARRETDWDVLCWPENGEYASSTYFVTDDPEPRLNIARFPREHDAFALFSDGVGELALSQLEQVAHTKFLAPMMRPVDSASGTGRLPELSLKLKGYLSSPAVCQRTDDDKTLVLISGG